LIWYLLVLGFTLSANIRKVESKTKEFIHFFAKTENPSLLAWFFQELRHLHGKDNEKEPFHKTIT
jgi:hypothetical protein